MPSPGVSVWKQPEHWSARRFYRAKILRLRCDHDTRKRGFCQSLAVAENSAISTKSNLVRQFEDLTEVQSLIWTSRRARKLSFHPRNRGIFGPEVARLMQSCGIKCSHVGIVQYSVVNAHI